MNWIISKVAPQFFIYIIIALAVLLGLSRFQVLTLELDIAALGAEKNKALTEAVQAVADAHAFQSALGKDIDHALQLENDSTAALYEQLIDGLRFGDVSAPSLPAVHRTGGDGNQEAYGTCIPKESVIQIIGYARIAEEQTNQLVACQKYVNEMVKQYGPKGK